VDESEKYRSFYAKLICAAAKLDEPRIAEHFARLNASPLPDPDHGGYWPFVTVCAAQGKSGVERQPEVTRQASDRRF
jgi:hypothetical protein